jgi:hypothetical protein
MQILSGENNISSTYYVCQGKKKIETNRLFNVRLSVWNTFTLSPIRAFLSIIALLMCEFFPIPMGMPPFSARSFLLASVWRKRKPMV